MVTLEHSNCWRFFTFFTFLFFFQICEHDFQQSARRNAFPQVTTMIICAHAATSYCFWRRLCVCLSVCSKSRKLLVRNWCNLIETCPMVNARSVWNVVTFDPDLWPWELFSYFLFGIHISYIIGSFECRNLATSFSVQRYIFRISKSPSSFKVTGLISRSRLAIEKSGRAQVYARQNSSNLNRFYL